MHSFFSFYVGYLVPASTLLPIIAGIAYYKKINKPLRTLLVYLSIAFVINVAGSILAEYNQNNLPLLHVYTIFELLAVMLYYKQAFDSKPANRWANIAMLAFPVLCILNFIFLQSIWEFNTYTRPLGALVIIVFSIIYLASQGSFRNHALITSSGRLVASGFLVYFCSSLFQFIFSNVVSHTVGREIKMMIWNIHATFVLIMYLFFLKAILNERNNR